jgi:hypothetical protein
MRVRILCCCQNLISEIDLVNRNRGPWFSLLTLVELLLKTRKFGFVCKEEILWFLPAFCSIDFSKALCPYLHQSSHLSKLCLTLLSILEVPRKHQKAKENLGCAQFMGKYSLSTSIFWYSAFCIWYRNNVLFKYLEQCNHVSKGNGQ